MSRHIPRRIIRFLATSDDLKSGYDPSTTYYGILGNDQVPAVGTKVDIMDYDNIYDPSTYKRLSLRRTIGKVLPPIDPVNIFCVGLNYKFHASESKMALPTYPVIFAKPTSAVIADGEDIVLPQCVHKGTSNADPGECDYEVEVVIVIGKECKNVTEEEAADYILGYSIANDVSARQWQLDEEKSGSQWIRGKSFDTFCPFGPCLLMEGADGVDAQNLDLWCTLNGETVQSSNTKHMIFSIRKLVSFLSQGTTLKPGTIILSGTPDGVGFARNPKLWLKDGDEVVVGVDGIGKLVNSVKNEKRKAKL